MGLPIEKLSSCSDSKGNFFIWEVRVDLVDDWELYPEGFKAIFRLKQMSFGGKSKLVVLIDNHAPYGFHEHDKLPEDHNSRVVLNVQTWQEAFDIFQKRCREILR